MNLAEQMDFIKRLEARYPVEEWTIDGILVWPMIRVTFAEDMFARQFRSAPAAHSSARHRDPSFQTILAHTWGYLKAYSKDHRGNDRLKGQVDYVFLTNTLRRQKLMGHYYDRICDPVIDNLRRKGKKVTVLEMTADHHFLYPRHNPSIWLQLKADHQNLFRRIRSRGAKPSPQVSLTGWEAFRQEIAPMVTSIDDYDLPAIIDKTLRLRDRADLFKKLLMQARPQTAFADSFYAEAGMAFCLACRELDIPVIDIQHGVTGEYHRHYASWTRVPAAGYQLLPAIFWCWTEEDARVIENWSAGNSRHRAVVKGNPWLMMWKAGDSQITSWYDARIEERFGDKTLILITLQSHLSDYGLFDWLIEAMQHGDENWQWLVKLHPKNRNEIQVIEARLKSCGVMNADVKTATEFPLPALLRHVKVHITGYSTSLLDALEFGIPSIITHESGREIFADQLAAKDAVSVQEPKSLLDAIDLLLRN